MYTYHIGHMYTCLYAYLYTQKNLTFHENFCTYISGMTDYAVQAWFSLIATGLGVPEDDSRKRKDGVMDFWY
jgi:hypothetical protein